MSIPKSKIYTKTGDSGVTSLYSGERVYKSNIIFDILGTIDELNASICVACNFHDTTSNNTEIVSSQKLRDVLIITKEIEEICHVLFDIGAIFADTEKRKLFDEKNITSLELKIDINDSKCPPLGNFILPSGGKMSSLFHLSRAICRRLERLIVQYTIDNNDQESYKIILRYINRLSDYLFVTARCVSTFEVIHK